MISFSIIKQLAEDLKATYSTRDGVAKDLEDIYLMRDTASIKKLQALGDDIAITKSPDARNAVTSARRLLTTTDPVYTCPHDPDDATNSDVYDEIEKAAEAWIMASDRATGRKPLHYNATLSALLFDEIHIAVESTKDMLAAAQGQPPAIVQRAKRIAKSTPYLFHVLPARECYAEWDNYGLKAHLSVSTTTAQTVIDRYGQQAEKILGERKNYKGAADNVDIWEYWDLVTHTIWVDESSQPILHAEHGLPFIPVAARTAEGSDLFEEPEDQREPFLFTEYQSGLHMRKTEALTSYYTMLRVQGIAAPVMVFTEGTQGQDLPTTERVGLMQYVRVPAGGQFGPMGGKIDPSFMTGLEIAERKTEESTMYRTAAGGSLPAGSAFSTHAMLAQLGRLPLETIRAMTGIAIADALSIAFEWYKTDGGKYNGYNAKKKTQIELNAADIPESVMIECNLDINLPQDKLQQAGIFNALWDKLPPDYLVETVLGEGQYDDMLSKLWSYQAANAHFGAYMQAQMAQAQQQQGQPPMMQGAPPPQEGMSLPPGIPVEQLQMGAQPPEAPMMEGEMPA